MNIKDLYKDIRMYDSDISLDELNKYDLKNKLKYLKKYKEFYDGKKLISIDIFEKININNIKNNKDVIMYIDADINLIKNRSKKILGDLSI